VLIGLGVADHPAREGMFNVEVAQRWLLNQDLQQVVPDPEGKVTLDMVRTFADALIADKDARRRCASTSPPAIRRRTWRDLESESILGSLAGGM
jgi:hypothetical protein